MTVFTSHIVWDSVGRGIYIYSREKSIVVIVAPSRRGRSMGPRHIWVGEWVGEHWWLCVWMIRGS